MTEVLLYHHVQGLTDGVRAFADELRAAGHVVHTPDMFEGRTFESIEDGIVPFTEFGDAWPDGVPVHIHAKENDPWFLEDLPAAQELVASAADGELFLYPGDTHLFADASTPDYDPEAAA